MIYKYGSIIVEKKHNSHFPSIGSQLGLTPCTGASYPTHSTYPKYESCKHFRQKVEFGDTKKYTILCSAYSDIPKKEEDADKAQKPDLGVYMDSGWAYVIDPIKVSPGVRDYPTCKTFYDTILVAWADRDVPNKDMLDELVTYLQKKMDKGVLLDIGCHGGHGRTGTLLGCLMARLTDMDPGDVIKWIRKNYCSKAIESIKQEDAIYRIVGKEPPKHVEPVKSVSLPTVYQYSGNSTLAEIIGKSKDQKLGMVTNDKCMIIHECSECRVSILIGEIAWHTSNWQYLMCDHCYEDMKEQVKNSVPANDSKVWICSSCGNTTGIFSCTECKKTFMLHESMWHHSPTWEPLLCEKCYRKMSQETELIADDAAEKDQFAAIVGFASYSELATDMRKN